MGDLNVPHCGFLRGIDGGSTWSMRTLAAIAALVAIGGSGPATAGTKLWTTNGPYGGQVTVLAVDPQTPANLYAAGSGTIFKSVNGGTSWTPAGSTSWQPATSGLVGFPVQAMIIDPVTPTTLYADSVQIGKLVKSIDGAASWQPVGPTLIVSLAIDPKTPATVYAGQQQGGIYKSTNGGADWANTGFLTLPPFPTFKALAVDPQTPATLYAGESTQGIFKSMDGGATWAAASTGFTGPIIAIASLAIDPQTTATLYAVASTSGGDGLYKSTDGGAHWTRILAPATANNFFIGTVTVDPQTPSTIYVGTGNGPFKSTNGGTSFTPVQTGLPATFVNVLAINPQSPATVYAGTTNGVFATTNAGAAWTAASNGIALTIITAVAMDPLTETTIYAGTASSGLFKSVDGGNAWTDIDTGIGPTGNLAVSVPSITSLAIDPVTPATLYAGSQFTQSSMVLKSINGGASWTNSGTGIPISLGVFALAIDPSNPRNIIAGTLNSGVYRSSDAGASWARANTGMPAGAGVVGLAYGTTSPQSLWAAVKSPAGDSMMNSTDGGATWSSTYPGFDPSRGLVFVIDFLRTTIGINSLTFISNPRFTPPYGPPLPATTGVNLVDCLPITVLLADPKVVSDSYVAAGCGVLKGTNNGAQLTAMNAGLPQIPTVNALVITPAGDRLYAGTTGGGVYTFSSGAKIGVVIEFYNTLLDNYFITANPVEAAAIDGGSAGPGWIRTGTEFNFNSGGDTYVCRFYGSISPGPNSHFYTVSSSECDGLKALQATTPATEPRWNFESLDFVSTPPANGACPTGTVPVYRAYNDGFNRHVDSNHRITVNQAGIAAVVARGWISEGVVMCAPG